MSDYVIETHGLTRYFGQTCAVNQVDLAIPRGKIYALLGRNGSGKTTTIRMLMGMLSPTRGSAKIMGCDSTQLTPELRSKIGYLTESHYVYGWMRVRECAAFQAATFATWNQKLFDAVVSHFGLTQDMKASALSRGERAGLCLALTLATEPELLVLDDPALGLDPVARRALVEAMLMVTSDSDRTILFSSHLLDDVERVADHIAIIDQSVLRVQCSVDEFRSRISLWSLRYSERPARLPDVPGIVHSNYYDGELRLTLANCDKQVEQQLNNAGALSVERSTLSLDQSVIDYLTDRRCSGSLLEAVGKGANV
jgi:ABC-2 type transport system ATP-binding protein